MVSGSRSAGQPLGEVMGKLRMLLAAAGCEIITSGKDYIDFRHGTYLTQTVSMLPKRGTIRLNSFAGQTIIRYEIGASPFVRAWLTLWGVLLCWTIFVPIIAYLALAVHPRRFMERLLAGL